MITGTAPLDIFDFAKAKMKAESAICITTNTMLRSSGSGIMGAGIAKQAAGLCPEAEACLGELIRSNGACVGEIGELRSESGHAIKLLAFPTKHDWRDKSDIELIRQSAWQLHLWSCQHPTVKYILLPPVGCGLGGLDWESDVEPVVSAFLKGRKFITYFRK